MITFNLSCFENTIGEANFECLQIKGNKLKNKQQRPGGIQFAVRDQIIYQSLAGEPKARSPIDKTALI